MIFIIAGLCLAIYRFFDFKKSFLLYLCFQLLLGGNVTLISVPGLPNLTLELTLTFFYIASFIIHGSKYQNAYEKFPLKLPFILYTFSLLISSIFSVAGFLEESTNFIKQILENVILVRVIWQSIDSKKDFNYAFRIITIIIIFSCIYGFYEYSIKSNPISDYKLSMNVSNPIDWTYGADRTRGYRIKSIFDHSIGAGMNWSLYVVAVLTILTKKRIKPSKMVLPIIAAILCVPCIILTNSRSPIIFFLICLLMFISPKQKWFFYALPIVLIFSISIIPLLPEGAYNLILGFFDKSVSSSLGGSSLSMRLNQFDASFQLLATSPIYGLGPSFKSVINNDLTKRLLGSESIWFSVLPETGAIGIFAYLVQIYYTIFKIPLFYKNKSIFFTCLAYWITCSITSIPGFVSAMFYLFIFYNIKFSDVYALSRNKGIRYCLYFSRGVIYKKIVTKIN